MVSNIDRLVTLGPANNRIAARAPPAARDYTWHVSQTARPGPAHWPAPGLITLNLIYEVIIIF